MKLYELKPIDTLFFRDSRPFTMGIGMESFPSIIFPPYPQTVYGAIRTWLIFKRGGLEKFCKGELQKELGTPEKLGSLEIKGPLLTIEETPYFKAPKDLLIEKGGENKPFKTTLVQKNKFFISDYKLEQLHFNKSANVLDDAENYFVDQESLLDYLKRQKDSSKLTLTEAKKLFVEERKVGIKRNYQTRTTEEGYLYSIPTIRLKPKVSLLVNIDGLNQEPLEDGEVGVLELGGEKRLAKIKKLENLNILNLEEYVKELNFEDKKFKIYLATPAIFENGWLPSWIDSNSFVGDYEGIKLRLIACSIGKYELVAGWDMANEKPKSTKRLIPQGSVYVFEIIEGTKEQIIDAFHLKNISDGDYAKLGFGLSLVGKP